MIGSARSLEMKKGPRTRRQVQKG